MIVSMLCWGSWANTRKLTIGYAFSLFYWDYVLGILLGSVLWGFTLGNIYGGDSAFLPNLLAANRSHVLFAVTGGVVFNVANLLLVAAIDVAGMAGSFTFGIWRAPLASTVFNYPSQPPATTPL